MGNVVNLPGLQSNRQLKREHFLHYYEEGIAKEYFPQSRSYGYRMEHIQQQGQVQLAKFGSTQTTQTESTKKILISVKNKYKVDAGIYPFCCIGLLIIHFEEHKHYATGSLIGKNIILTAASNIYNKDLGRFAERIQFVLGVNKGKGIVYEIDRKFIHFNEKHLDEAQGSHRYNYALLQVEEEYQSSIEEKGKEQEKGVNDISSHPGLKFGYLGIKTSLKAKQTVHMYGYSANLNEEGDVQYQLQEGQAQNIFSKNSSLGYKMESQASECGSPLVVCRGDYYQVVGIHINGTKGLSCGLAFDENIRKDINRWVQQVEGSIQLVDTALSNLQLSKFVALQWHNMVIININNNKICDKGLTELTKKCWPMLRELHMCQNNISKLDIQPRSIININKFLLAQNHIKNAGILSKLTLLKVLNLSVNKIDHFDELCVLTHMQRMDFTSNKLTKLPTELSKMKELKKLYLSRNELENLIPDIIKLPNLTLLTIDGNKFKSQPVEIISKLQGRGVEVISQ